MATRSKQKFDYIWSTDQVPHEEPYEKPYVEPYRICVSTWRLKRLKLPNSLIIDEFKFSSISPLCCRRKSTHWPCHIFAKKDELPLLHNQGSWEDWWANVWHRCASSNLPPTMHLDTLFHDPHRQWCLTLQMNAMNNRCHLSKKENKQRKPLLMYSEHCVTHSGHTKRPCEQVHSQMKVS